MKKTALTISRLAREAGVGVETVRYYQRVGLLTEPPKPAQGYRAYPGEALNRLRFIARAKELGFTLNEIKDLLQLDNADCEQTQQIASQKLQAIQARIHDLSAMAESLEQLLRTCQGHDTTSACPIIDSLSKPEQA